MRGRHVADTKSPDQMVDDIEQIRDRLAATVDELIDRVSPKSIAGRRKAKIQAHFVAPDGSVRTENVVPIVLYAVGAVAGIAALRKILG